ncbi:hypothetical protein CGLO_02959 [Colletotrichum gloeosporioides Cg-14]|uniref:Uncharacterized protein n=1 Tax=Colletotrichum gloeosporioides (strain Cg-14) TaxID=1237896 RepID=T0KXT1_COLGC|nr:hypothetical protein CGLO_02959 [Colletotrichum gloeosporioides Cg-14]
MCQLAKATCETCQEPQTVLVERKPSDSHPNAVNFLTNEFHFPCENAKLTGNDCGWVRTKHFQTTVPEMLCKKCQAYPGGSNYRDWLETDIKRRENLAQFIMTTKQRKTWWKVYLC